MTGNSFFPKIFVISQCVYLGSTHFVVCQIPIPSFTGLFRGRFVQVETFKSVDQTTYPHFFIFDLEEAKGRSLRFMQIRSVLLFFVNALWDKMNVKLLVWWAGCFCSQLLRLEKFSRHDAGSLGSVGVCFSSSAGSFTSVFGEGKHCLQDL